MKKEGKVQNNKKRLIILIAVIALIGIIIGSIVIRNVVVNQEIRNVVVNQEAEGENYLAGGNASSSLMASYIRKGVTIGGITGTLESLDTSDATATSADIAWGKTAYVKGEKLTGTYVPSSNYTFTDSLGNIVRVPRRICSSKSTRQCRKWNNNRRCISGR